MIVVLDILLLAAALYFIFSWIFRKEEKFETSGYNSTVNTYSPVNTSINYNNDYIVNNFSKLLYEFAMEIERETHQTSTITPSIVIPEEDFSQSSMVKRQYDVNLVIEKLNNKFNKPLAVIEIDKSYGIKEAFGPGYIYLIFKVNVTPEFNEYAKNDDKSTQIGVSNESKFKTYNTVFLALTTRYELYQLRLYELESIDTNKVNGNDTAAQQSQNLNFPYETNLRLSDNEIKEQAQKYVDENHKEEEGKCFIREGVEDNIGFNVDCKLNGGIWDSVCNKDTECPFYDGENGGCNLDTGYCAMPKGTKNISYKKYEGIPEKENEKLIF